MLCALLPWIAAKLCVIKGHLANRIHLVLPRRLDVRCELSSKHIYLFIIAHVAGRLQCIAEQRHVVMHGQGLVCAMAQPQREPHQRLRTQDARCCPK